MGTSFVTVLASIAIAVVALVSTPSTAHAAAPRIAVIVGNNIGLPSEVELRYAESDAEKMAKVLVDLGGFRADDTLLVVGQTPAALDAALVKLAARVGHQAHAQIFFYYSGHGDGAHLHMAGREVAIAEVQQRLATVPADLRVIVVDSCRSGELTRQKGASRGPSFDIDVVEDTAVAGSIVITSSSPDEVSQESDRLQGSFFTHYWVSGLYGAADTDRDGLVTLEEAYRFAHFATIDGTIESRAGVQHPSYRFALSGQGSVVIANLARSTATVSIPRPDRRGQYFVVDPQKRLVLTELAVGADGSATIRLPPGHYRIRKRESARFLEEDASLAAGQTLIVRDVDMKVVPYTQLKSKGEGSRRPFGVEAHGPEVLGGLRTPLLHGLDTAATVTLAYQLEWGALFVRPRLRLTRSEASPDANIGDVTEFDGGGAIGWYLHEGTPSLLVATDGGLVLFDQQPRAIAFATGPEGPQGALPLGFSASALAELGIPLGDSFSVVLGARAGAELFRDGGALTLRPTFELGLGVRYIVH